jgi:uncharacterized tellurite resistance protein B-like protein
MLRAIKAFFQQHIVAEVHRPETREHGLRLATAALLMEMTRADFTRRPEELSLVAELVQAQFGLTGAETRELAELADAEVREAISLYQFTGLINEHFSPEEKLRVVEMLWQVAYADRVLDKHEEYLVRQVAELLYVPHRDFIRAKHRVQEALGLE